METSAQAPALEKKEAKSGLLEDSSFPDPGKKACPLAVAAPAA
ncbi:rCG64213, partial [Rattus norvegicus]